ncbi:MAG: pyrroline-5-carboxylate reductase [Deltaproteobacteria bacterium]|nr:pyrroline-5-carboxylate reductase [Candidatus Zymogenaceae bacterium]
MNMNVGFIGAGKMAEALISGILKNGMCTPERIIAADVSRERLEYMKTTFGIRTTDTNHEAAQMADVLFIAVKPHLAVEAVREVAHELAGVLVVSIAAGVTLEILEEAVGKDIAVVRVMPNTPALVGCGMAALAAGTHADDGAIQTVRRIMEAVGEAVVVAEDKMDAVTAVSGSGPAYIYLVIEAMADGGVRAGLPRDVALRLAAKTAMGAAHMVLETGEHPGRLKDNVTSPGGTTIEAMATLEKNGVRGAFIEAVEKAYLRAKEMGS